MGIFQGVIAILGMKPVQSALNGLVGKLFGKKNAIDKKVVAAGGVALWVTIIIAVATYFDAGLAAILQANQEVLVGIVGLVQLIVAYYTSDELVRG